MIDMMAPPAPVQPTLSTHYPDPWPRRLCAAVRSRDYEFGDDRDELDAVIDEMVALGLCAKRSPRTMPKVAA